jgi:hypothetical protein
MTTRKNRSLRSRKQEVPAATPLDDVMANEPPRIEAKYPSDAPPVPPSLAEELAVLDAGWD